MKSNIHLSFGPPKLLSSLFVCARSMRQRRRTGSAFMFRAMDGKPSFLMFYTYILESLAKPANFSCFGQQRMSFQKVESNVLILAIIADGARLLDDSSSLSRYGNLQVNVCSVMI